MKLYNKKSMPMDDNDSFDHDFDDSFSEDSYDESFDDEFSPDEDDDIF